MRVLWSGVLVVTLLTCGGCATTTRSGVAGLQRPSEVGDLQTWFEAGQYERVVQTAGAQTEPMALYLIGMSYERLERVNDARATYEQLAARTEQDAWGFVGRAAVALVSAPEDGDPAALARADEAVQRAVSLAPSLAAVHYQQGLVESHKRDHAAAAAAFVEAARHDPEFAYAHYYAGLSYSRLDRSTPMAVHFERFLRLAPDAPEARQVRALMQRVRGR